MMDRRFNMDNFERSLKTHADEFKMMPSKKVWRGIYNDLHPGTRWPSVAMSLVFIFTLVIIGHLNTNNGQVLASLNSTGKNLVSGNTSAKKKIKPRILKPVVNTMESTDNIIADNSTDPGNPNATSILQPDVVNTSFTNISGSEKNNPEKNVSGQVTEFKKSFSVKTDHDNNGRNNEIIEKESFNTTGNINKTNTEPAPQIVGNTEVLPIAMITKAIKNKPDNKKDADLKQQIKNKGKASTDRQEDKTSGSSFLSKKVRDKITITYYASPSISYRNLSEKKIVSGATQLSSPGGPAGLNISTNSVVNNSPIVGLEAGAGLNYKLSKRWQAIAGLQLNYAGYNIRSNYVHPVSTTLLLMSDFTGEPYAFNSISNYGNASSTSHITLHQYSFQVSSPLGLKYMIAQNNNIQFNAEATIQPSYIFADKAYLLSADKRNYVTEPSLLRSLNMSTNIGTFVSFNSNNFKWQIGPQVFYQLLSTYSPTYPTREHLINYGVRFGVSKLKK